MKNLTVLAAALAAGLTTFAANAQGEGVKEASAAASNPAIETTHRTKDDLVEKADAPMASPATRGLTAEEVFHSAKTATTLAKDEIAEAKAPKQKDDIAAVARRQKDDIATAVAVKQKDDVAIAAPKKQKDDVAALAPKLEDRYKPIIEKYASENGVPVELAHAVITVESNYRPYSLGRAGEVGLMQIKPATAELMGYSGSKTGLFDPETNIKYGMKYLGKARKLGDGTTCGTILKYNAGHGAKRMNPVSRAYCQKVKRHLAAVKTTLRGL